MAIGVLIESLLGGPTVSTTTSGNTSGGDIKGGAREWIKKQIESFITVIRKIGKESIGGTTRNHRFNNFMDFEQS